MASSATRSRRASRSPLHLLVSCEHGGNRVPARYAGLFAGREALLASHRGYDAGSAYVARALARKLGSECFVAHITRLLVDLNRSAHHGSLFSELTRALPAEEKERVLRDYYRPYRARVEAAVERALRAGGRVLHVSSHSFTSVLRGETRRADVAFLYDPRRPREKRIAAAWRAALLARQPDLAVRFNYPYRGVADGLVTHLRRHFGSRYAGIELELNQRHVLDASWRGFVGAVAASLHEVTVEEE